MGPRPQDFQRVHAALQTMIRKVDRAEPFALAVEAAPVGRRQLERSFRRLGTSPDRELRRVRLELASAELTAKEASFRPLRGIAMRVGYRDLRRLREATGLSYRLSPSELRRGARIERKMKEAEASRRGRQGRSYTANVWNNSYRRRRDREALQRLLRKATAQGAALMLGQVDYPRAAEAAKTAPELARVRVLELVRDLDGKLLRAA